MSGAGMLGCASAVRRSVHAARHHPHMSFDDALAFLLSLVGERVEVAVESPAGGLVAHFSGTLAQGHELVSHGESASVFFSFDDGATGFVVSPAAFAKATRTADGRAVRIDDHAGVALLVERAEPLDRP
jgi:hypothetical protein